MKNILISNDDGVHAPGINILYETLAKIANVTVIAPMEERSTTGHTLTLDNHLRVKKIATNIYGCSGYPADCSYLGFAHIMKDKKPDLVISGINKGANMGQDIYYSGTVAAAREAVFHNIPALSVSLDIHYSNDEHNLNYETAALFISKILKLDLELEMDPYTLLNINVPNLPEKEIKGHEITNLSFRNYSEEVVTRLDARDGEYHWLGGVYTGHDEKVQNSDCHAVKEGKISITPIDLVNRYGDLKPKWQKIFQAI